MDWTSVLIFAAIVALFLLSSRVGLVSAAKAKEHLKRGAIVVDVRTPAEFNTGHLSRAINIPFDEVETLVPRRVTDKGQVLLLHCQSGMRSGIARKKLAALGYTRAFNLGSYRRAARIAGNV
jgi:phage shock protein E